VKIYTRKGDKGTTSLLSGERIPKDDKRLEAYGTIDELLSYLGLIRDLTTEESLRTPLLKIQQVLMTISSLMAADGKEFPGIHDLDDREITFLEKEIDRMNETLPPLKHFIIPGGDPLSSHCHIARTICRRAERRIIPLLNKHPELEKTAQYLNRLSDYLFVLAREVIYKNNKNENIW
jgi:cob(I)alamin adenosyltransferase